METSSFACQRQRGSRRSPGVLRLSQAYGAHHPSTSAICSRGAMGARNYAISR